MNSQFVIPEHKFPEVEPYSKEYFQKYKRHMRDEAVAAGIGFQLSPNYSVDLMSNLVSREDKIAYQNGRRIVLSKKFTFACSHALPFHKGKCKFLHGHEWEVEVFVQGVINDEGMLMDFSDLKKAVNEHFIETVDHGYLNALVGNPTAENICYYIWNVLQYNAGLKGIHMIQVWETPTSCATLTIEMMNDWVEGMWAWTL